MADNIAPFPAATGRKARAIRPALTYAADGSLIHNGRPVPAKFSGATWVARSLEFLTSPAWGAASHDVRRLLERLEIEHLLWSGKRNGSLIATYDDLEAAGLDRNKVRRAIHHAMALGFLVRTRMGWGSAKQGLPSTYQLTYVKSTNNKPPKSDEWRAIKTEADAREALKVADAQLESDRERERLAKTNKTERRSAVAGGIGNI